VSWIWYEDLIIETGSNLDTEADNQS
jgi:hypothetical protein